MVGLSGNNIVVLSANCQGLQNLQKRRDVLMYFKETNANIVCLQDTHWVEKDFNTVKAIWGHECFISGSKTNSRGVAILLKNNFEYKINSSTLDTEGNFVSINIETTAGVFNILSLYGPNTDNPNFFIRVKEILLSEQADYQILCGDFNIVLDPKIDAYNYRRVNNPKARQCVLDMKTDLDLSDIYRETHHNTKRYTWRKNNPLKQARLDYFLVSNAMSDIVKKCDIKPGYRSDHSAITFEFELNKFTTGKGVWKMNNSLLTNNDYVSTINNIIEEEILKYALPVYNLKFLKNIDGNVQFKIDSDLFLELLFLRIRGETIKFASMLKKKTNLKEKQLINDIESIESNEVLKNTNYDLLIDKKTNYKI